MTEPIQDDVEHATSDLAEASRHLGAASGLLDSLRGGPFVAGLRELGVVTAFPGLRDSPLEPERCIEATTKVLRFVGHGARKWRYLDAFEPFLARISQARGRVDFILDHELSASAVSAFVGLEKAYEAFSVRVLLEPPLLRMVEIDRRYVSIQGYPKKPSTENNWDLAGIVFSPAGADSMFPTFSGYIDRLWASGIPIAEFDEAAE